MQVLTEDNFDELYSPQKNHLDDNASWGHDGQMYETYGEELEYVLSLVNDFDKHKRVWTIVENNGKTSVIAGYHIVNRMGYLVTKVAWVDGDESFDVEGVDEEQPLSYIFYKDDFSDVEFYDLIAFQLGLPQYCDIFDRGDETEIADEYRAYFSEGASVEVLHENLRITDGNVLKIFLSDYANTSIELDEAITYRVRPFFQLSGDGLGFILDVWLMLEDMQESEEPNDSFTFWFEDYEF